MWSSAWRMVLVDLRNHGKSTGIGGPNTLDAAADDLIRLGTRIGFPQVLLGHSLGGKVVLKYLQHVSGESPAAPVGTEILPQQV